jgi:hypothetical protein
MNQTSYAEIAVKLSFLFLKQSKSRYFLKMYGCEALGKGCKPFATWLARELTSSQGPCMRYSNLIQLAI